ncbi:hypothetical protein ILUMI_00126 [Ignelater luminosus]|uniref:Uncharacterized protein n=1 Tax=Ignelater luminosus TaxID=2038154 RepID=A0A8K0DMY1_IGNLU|nr:hypothetical protein ILUMI_00126 [Ignelater luminosus]
MLEFFILSVMCSASFAYRTSYRRPPIPLSTRINFDETNEGMTPGICLDSPEMLKECVCPDDLMAYCKYIKHCPSCPKRLLPVCTNKRRSEIVDPICPLS